MIVVIKSATSPKKSIALTKNYLLPIMLDPSHGTGKSQYVSSMALSSIAAGTDSLMIEVHPNPAKALSDAPQSLTPEQYYLLMEEMKVIAIAVGRPWKSAKESMFKQLPFRKDLTVAN